jgi:hypothetical protein
MITAPSPKPASKIIKAGMSPNTRPPKTIKYIEVIPCFFSIAFHDFPTTRRLASSSTALVSNRVRLGLGDAMAVKQAAGETGLTGPHFIAMLIAKHWETSKLCEFSFYIV